MPDMERIGIEEIWSRYLIGATVTAVEEEIVARAMHDDPVLRAELLRDRHLDGVLREIHADDDDGRMFVAQFLQRQSAERDGRKFVARLERRLRARAAESSLGGRRARWPALAAAVALAAGVVLFVERVDRAPGPAGPVEVVAGAVSPTAASERPPTPTNMPAARLRSVAGSVLVITDGQKLAARAGQALAADQGLLTPGRASNAVIEFDDGTRIDVEGDSVVTGLTDGRAGRGKGLFLAAGTLRARVPPQPAGRPFILATPQAEATVVGTVFLLSTTSAATRLQVYEGHVRLRRSREGEKVEVAAGQHAVAAEGQALRAARTGGVAYLVGGTTSLGPSDALIKRRLESLDFDVRVRGGGGLRASDLRDGTIVVLSATIQAVDVTTSLRDLPVPILTNEIALFNDLGMTATASDEDQGTAHTQSGEIVIRNALHPMAAGLSGTVRVTAANTLLRWGTPGPFAEWIATLPGRPTSAVIFGYDVGAIMPGGFALPMRRVGFFLSDRTAVTLTEVGWDLFDAAVRWCTSQ